MKKMLSLLLCFVFLLFPFSVSAQNELHVIREGDRSSMKIALTFDDGPHPYRTDEVLNLLENYGIRATFFVVGENVSYYPEPFKRTVALGHEIGNHTYHHTPLSDTSEKTVMEEIRQTDEIIFKTAGFHPKLFRPPEGAYGECALKTAQSMDMRMILWTVDTRDWERQTNFAMFDANGEFLFDQEVGIKVRGTSTRGAAQKSLNVYAREEYGNKEFSEEVFGTRTRSIILRNDFVNMHHLGQGYLQDLISDRDVLTQESYPVLVFLEGEYCGLYILYERFSENFVEDHYGIADDNIWTAKKFAGDWGAEFDAPNTQSLLACQQDLNDIFVYIRDHDMSQKEHYDYVCSKIDMDSLIDLLCFQLYIGNVDFSLAQNISAWRAIEVDPTNPYADGRWRFVVYDLDISMVWNAYNVSSNPFTEDQPYAGPGFLDFQISTCYFKLSGNTLVKDTSRRIRYDFADKIMASPLFCEQFVKTMQDLGNFNFAPDRVKAVLDAELALISPVYATYRKRVVKSAYENTDPDVDEQLINNLMNKYNSYLDYFNRRYAIITGYMASAFSLKGTQNKVTIAVSGVDDAALKINTSTNTISKNGVQVSYYSDYNVTFEALQAPEGYKFDRWIVNGGQLVSSSATDSIISVSMAKNASLSITAVYVPIT